MASVRYLRKEFCDIVDVAVDGKPARVLVVVLGDLLQGNRVVSIS